MRLETALPEAMERESLTLEGPASSCNQRRFRFSSTVPLSENMTAALRPVLAGLFVTLVQIVLAVCLLAPEGPFSYRYSTLNQHDSFWFMNIVERGYQTIVPPINHKVMEV